MLQQGLAARRDAIAHANVSSTWLENPMHFSEHHESLIKTLLTTEQRIEQRLVKAPVDQPRFVFLNVGETHVPYWHEGASWERWPSPCVPFGDENCSATESARRQRACLEWVDQQVAPLLNRFVAGTVFVCADHGDCWGEDGLWEHGISHPATLTVPLLMRVRGAPVQARAVQPITKRQRLRKLFTRLLP